MSLNGADGIRETIAGATEVSGDGVRLEAEILRLAALPYTDYVFEKRQAAKAFKISLAEIDKLVRDKQKQIRYERQRCIVETEAETQKEDPETADPAAADDFLSGVIDALYESAKPLIEADSVRALVREHLTKNEGYAGDTAPAERIFVAVCSRFGARPINIRRLAVSAAGKSHTVDCVLVLFSEDAYYKISASSEKALIYTAESFEHKYVIVSEQDSLPQDGPAASAVRSIAQDNVMTYDVVEKGEDNQWAVRHIVKPGPTGVITTGTTAFEDDQMDTRMLTDRVSDDAAQTRLIVRMQAAVASGTYTRNTSERQKFVDFQKYLALKGERRIVVPFAEALGELIPVENVRVRRDFPQILTAIETLAFIAQFHPERKKDALGRVVATWRDYEDARELLAPILDVSITDGVSATVRQTVEAIGLDEEISLPILAGRLKLSKTGTWYRVKSAIDESYLVNLEDRPRHAARIKRAQPLPDPKSALPTVGVLKAEFQKRVPDEQPEENLPAQDEEGLEL